MIINQQPPTSGGSGGLGTAHAVNFDPEAINLRDNGTWDDSGNTTRNTGDVVVAKFWEVFNPMMVYNDSDGVEHSIDIFGNDRGRPGEINFYGMFVMPDSDIFMM